MKTRIKLSTVLMVCAMLAPSATVLAKTKTKKPSVKERQEEISSMAEKTLNDLFSENTDTKSTFEAAKGYAVFDNTKIALGLSGGGGSGVAVDKQSGHKTFMKMATGGIGLGLGAQKYKVIFLFETKEAFENFVEKGWTAQASANAAAGKEGVNRGSAFNDGVAIYQLTEKGLMAIADVSGTKYWKHKELNP